MVTFEDVDYLAARCRDGYPEACEALERIATRGWPWHVAHYAWEVLEEIAEEMEEMDDYDP